MRIVLVEDERDLALAGGALLRFILDDPEVRLRGLVEDAMLEPEWWEGVDAAIVDLHLPGPHDGIELLYFLRARAPWVRRVVATGMLHLPHEVAEAAHVVLRKPYTVAQLEEALAA